MKNGKTTVLVTGVGAIIGYGIIRSLRRLPQPPRIVGMDIYPDAVGQYWCDAFVPAAPAAADHYLSFIAETVAAEGIDLILPGIEQDVARLSQGREVLSSCGARLALNRAELIDLAEDKWSTYQALRAAGQPVIPTRIDGTFAELSAEFGTPFLLKPRRSYASKGICRVSDDEEFLFRQKRMGGGFMAQRIVGNDEEEYTVGVFGYGDGTASQPIVMRRLLSGEGATAKAWVVDEPQLAADVAGLVRLFQPVGPTNFQFRREGETFLLLEVNPRISSSTSLRAAFGFNEAAMCLDYYLHGRRSQCGPLRRGHAVRFIDELVFYASDHC